MENKIDWVVPENYIGKRLDAAINENFEIISRSEALAMIKTGEITLDENIVKPSTKLKGDEIVHINLREKISLSNLDPTPLNFPIIFEDEHIIVVNKPSGLVVHPGAGKETVTVVSALISHTKALAV